MTPGKVSRNAGRPKNGIHILDKKRRATRDAEPTERLQAVGLLASGVAHDFNNLLGVISGYCELLTGQEQLLAPARAMIAEIDKAAGAATRLARGLLEFSSGQLPQPVAVDLNECVRRMGSIVVKMTGEQVAWVEQLGAGLDRIEVQPGQVEQILMNLATNARDALPRGGMLTIETANAYLDEAYARQHPGTHPGNYVRLSVSDSGAGMDAETLARAFDPFFTTKPQGQGTGLGLSTVASIVKNCGGHIAVQSQPGCGTTFTIHFPRTHLLGIGPEVKVGAPSAKVTGTILLAEDCLPLRALTRRILEDAGYTVLEAGCTEDALTMAQSTTTAITLLITDVALPGASGFELAQRLSAFRPEVKALFMSGHLVDKQQTTRLKIAQPAFLEKPFTREKLLRLVNELMQLAIQGSEAVKFSPGSVALSVRPPGNAPLACS